MPVHHRAHPWRKFYYSYLSNLRSRFLADVRSYREYYISLYNYITYNDVD